nr:hypothetical protein [Klebsiella pneumoniae]
MLCTRGCKGEYWPHPRGGGRGWVNQDGAGTSSPDHSAARQLLNA